MEKIEKLSVSNGLRAVRFAEVVAVLIDARVPFELPACLFSQLLSGKPEAVQSVKVAQWSSGQQMGSS